MKWVIDPAHSFVEFAVRHMSISRVRGRFRKLSGVIDTDAGDGLQVVNVVIDAGSIDTGDPKRDAHLLSPDFLDAAQHSTLEFQSLKIDALGDGHYKVRGQTTIRGRTRPTVIEVFAAGPITDPDGNLRVGVRAEGRLSRMDWGLTWDRPLPFGGLLVGDTVWFTIDVEAVASAPATVT